MATIFTRGFMQRSLPALLALIMGLLVAPPAAVHSVTASAPATVIAVTPATAGETPSATAPAHHDATTHEHAAAHLAVHNGPSASGRERSAGVEPSRDALRAQLTGSTPSSRAPPSARA